MLGSVHGVCRRGASRRLRPGRSPPTHRRSARCGPSESRPLPRRRRRARPGGTPPGSGPRRRDRPVACPDRRRRRGSCGCGSGRAAWATLSSSESAWQRVVDLDAFCAEPGPPSSVRRTGSRLATCRRKRWRSRYRARICELGFLAADADRVHQEQHVDRRPAGPAVSASGAPRVGTGDGLSFDVQARDEATEVPPQVVARARVDGAPCAPAVRRRSGASSSRFERPGNPLDVVRRHEQARLLVADDLRDAADIARDDRDAARHAPRRSRWAGPRPATDGRATSLAASSDGTSSTWPRRRTRSPSPR